MGLSLRGTTSGAVDINAPAVAGDNTITLPGTNGAANQFYKNSGTAGIVTHSSMVEDSSGLVGIGLTNPGALLHLESNGVDAARLRIGFDSTRYYDIFRGSISNGGYLNFYGSQTGFTGYIFDGVDGERARIDTSGNVGIGTDSVPTNFRVEISEPGTVGLNLRNTNNSAGDSGRIAFSQGSGNLTSSNTFVDIIAEADTVSPLTGTLKFRTNQGNDLTEAMRIDSSGRLLLNCDTTGTARNDSPLQIETGSSGNALNLRCRSSDDAYSYLNFTNNAQTNVGAEIFLLRDASTNASTITFSTASSGVPTPTNRMQIDSRGQSLFLSDGTPSVDFMFSTVGATSGSTKILSFRRNATAGILGTGTECCVVRRNGDLENTNNAYGSLSDVKLKENIVDANSQWDDIKALQVRNYNFKAETGHQTYTQLGLIAQEVELVSPGLVKTIPDLDENDIDLGTTTKSVNYSVLYMKAIKALQEAITKIETLETQNADLLARVTALEG